MTIIWRHRNRSTSMHLYWVSIVIDIICSNSNHKKSVTDRTTTWCCNFLFFIIHWRPCLRCLCQFSVSVPIFLAADRHHRKSVDGLTRGPVVYHASLRPPVSRPASVRSVFLLPPRPIRSQSVCQSETNSRRVRIHRGYRFATHPQWLHRRRWRSVVDGNRGCKRQRLLKVCCSRHRLRLNQQIGRTITSWQSQVRIAVLRRSWRSDGDCYSVAFYRMFYVAVMFF